MRTKDHSLKRSNTLKNIEQPTQSRSLEQRMMLTKISL